MNTTTKRFLTSDEHDLLHTLTALYSDEYFIFAKPIIEEIFETRIAQKYCDIDFLICTRKSTRPILAIKMSDSKDKERSRIMRDIYAIENIKYTHLEVSKRNDKDYVLCHTFK